MRKADLVRGKTVKTIHTEHENVYTLFDDEGTRKKFKVMSKLEAMFDDSRNPDFGKFNDRLDELLQFGKSYRIRVIVEEV